MYHEEIDEKYGILVEASGRVKLTRYREDWLENPVGAKAWISVADRLEKVRLDKGHAPLESEEEEDAAKRIAAHLANSWFVSSEDESVKVIGARLSKALSELTRGLDVKPSELLDALTRSAES